MFKNDNTILENERRWIERLRDGDEKAFKKIYDHYHARLYYFSLRFMCSDDAAREIVQEVFVKLWTNRHAVDAGLSIQGYLYTIARHLNYKSLQKTARDVALKEEMIHRYAGLYHDQEDDVLYSEYLKIAEDAVDQLSPHRKLVFRMAWKDGMTPQEISINLDISVSTVKNHLVEARKYIRERLLLKADLTACLLLFVNVSLP